jgi:NTE family protein
MRNIIYVFLLHFGIVFQLNAQESGDFSGEDDDSQVKIGLALSGGAAKGFAHVGVLKVLEEVGIRPDYIAGTSMGGVIGSLYACGYDAKTIEKLSIEQNWDFVLTDNIYRHNVPFKDKDTYGKFVVSVPVENGEIKLPGLVKGQNVSNLLSSLLVDYHDVQDFSKLPIPFLCIAADLRTGNEVLIENGFLPKAVRASMSIPSVFEPAVIDGQKLIDGGVANNYPVQHLLDRGVDIVIGVDVGYESDGPAELNTFTDILFHSIFFASQAKSVENRKKTDVLITPNLSGFSAMSFYDADTIIKRGEVAAREMYDELEALAEYLRIVNGHHPNIKSKPLNDSVSISNVEVEGSSSVSHEFVLKHMDADLPVKLSRNELIDRVQQVYATGYFESVEFRIEDRDEGNVLVFFLEESTTRKINLGINYNSYENASITIHTSFKNWMRNNNNLDLRIRLSQNPEILADYILYRGLSPGLNLRLKGEQVKIYRYNPENGTRSESYNFRHVNFNAGFTSYIGNSYNLFMGLDMEYIAVAPDITPLTQSVDENILYNYILLFRKDSYDKKPYPTHGSNIDLEGKLITDDLLGYGEQNTPSGALAFWYDRYFSINNKLTFNFGLYNKYTFGDSIPYNHKVFVGGMLPDYFQDNIPFVGLDIMEMNDRAGLFLKFDARFRFLRNNYIILHSNAGFLEHNYQRMYEKKDLIIGGGVTFATSIINQPFELNFGISNKTKKLLPYLSFGYYF